MSSTTEKNTLQPVSGTLEMISSMTPTLHATTYVYASLPASTPASILAELIPHVHSITMESEGISLILPLSVCQSRSDLQLEIAPPNLRHIELQVFSSLEGIGLTAAVAAALTQEAIACNMVAGLRHDHVFVPEKDAQRAMETLKKVSDDAKAKLG